MDEEIFEFAMVISVAPECDNEWARALRSAKTPAGMTMAVRNPALAIFTVSAVQEFLAIDQAMTFLNEVAKSAGVRCALNAQPSHEV